jgi:hypothetical protein
LNRGAGRNQSSCTKRPTLRGGHANRGGHATRGCHADKICALHQIREALGEEEEYISKTKPETDEDREMEGDDKPPINNATGQHRIFEDITGPTKQLSQPVQKARKALMVSCDDMHEMVLTILQDMARRHFRNICGVSEGETWPLPDSVCLQEGTNIPYYVPHFHLGVQAQVNNKIFRKVANLTMEEFVSEVTIGTVKNSACYSAKPGILTQRII